MNNHELLEIKDITNDTAEMCGREMYQTFVVDSLGSRVILSDDPDYRKSTHVIIHDSNGLRESFNGYDGDYSEMKEPFVGSVIFS